MSSTPAPSQAPVPTQMELCARVRAVVAEVGLNSDRKAPRALIATKLSREFGVVFSAKEQEGWSSAEDVIRSAECRITFSSPNLGRILSDAMHAALRGESGESVPDPEAPPAARASRIEIARLLTKACTRLTQGKGYDVSIAAEFISHANLIVNSRLGALGDYTDPETQGVLHGLVLGAQALTKSGTSALSTLDLYQVLVTVLAAVRDAAMTSNPAVAQASVLVVERDLQEIG